MSFRFASGNLLLYYKHGSLTSYMHDVLNCSYKYDDKKLFTWAEQPSRAKVQVEEHYILT